MHQIDTVHWFTGYPRPRSVVANGGIYLWKDGRRNWDTMTGVFDYGPLDDPTKGFQVIYSSRMTNAAGDVKEYYYSNGGMLDLDKNTVTDTGGMKENYAKAMGMKANLLPSMSIARGRGHDDRADTGADDSTSANVRNWMECVRSRKTPNAQRGGRLQPLGGTVHDDRRHPDRPASHLRRCHAGRGDRWTRSFQCGTTLTHTVGLRHSAFGLRISRSR